MTSHEIGLSCSADSPEIGRLLKVGMVAIRL